MTYNPNHDRDYWRAATDRALLEAARDSGHELAIALGERLVELQDCADELHEVYAQLRELDKRCDLLRAELQTFYEAEGNA